MAIAGAFAGLAGAVDILGWKFHQAINDYDVSAVGFIGIAVALLGRNKAVGILFAALLFGALQVGTSPRQLSGTDFPPELATNLSTMIQALIILFVGAELLIVYVWNARKKVGMRTWRAPEGESARTLMSVAAAIQDTELAPPARRDEVDRLVRHRARPARLLARAAAVGRPLRGRADRGRDRRPRRRPLGGLAGREAARLVGDRRRGRRHRGRTLGSDEGHGLPRRGRQRRSFRRHDPLRHSARVRRDGRHLLRALRCHQRRPRGDDALGRLLRDLGGGLERLVGRRDPHGHGLRRGCSRSSTRSSPSTCAPTRSSADLRSTSSLSGSPATCSGTSTGPRERLRTSRASRP